MLTFYLLFRNGQSFPELPDLNNKKDMQESLNAEWNKNDLSQVQEKFKEEKANGSNGANGTGNLPNGILQYAANEIAKGRGRFVGYLTELVYKNHNFITNHKLY